MKKNLFIIAMLMMSVMAFAKDVKTVVFTTQPQMHCSSCEDKIKSNLRFEKGIKTIETSVENQTVTVTYDADKTTAENLQKGFEKFGYSASVVDNAAPADTTKAKKSCFCGKKAEGATAAAGGCCGGKKAEGAAAGGCCSKKAEGTEKKSCCCGKKAEGEAAAAGCCSKKAEGAAAGGCCSKKAEGAEKKSCCCGKKAEAAAGGCCSKKAEGAAAGGCCSKKADAAATGEKKSCCCGSKKAEEKK